MILFNFSDKEDKTPPLTKKEIVSLIKVIGSFTITYTLITALLWIAIK